MDPPLEDDSNYLGSGLSAFDILEAIKKGALAALSRGVVLGYNTDGMLWILILFIQMSL